MGGVVFRMEANLGSEQRRGGMNINNILCRKVVTMDIIEGRKFHSRPCLVCVCRCTHSVQDRAYLSAGIPRKSVCTHIQGLRSRLRGCVVVSHSNYLHDCGCLSMICVVPVRGSPCFIFPVIAAANLLCVGLMSSEVRSWGM